MELLLKCQANPNATDSAGRTCLHLSAINGRLDVSRVLLQHGACVNVFDQQCLGTPLFCAAMADNPDGIRFFLDNGADVNAGLHEYGISALHCAVRVNCVENVRQLLNAGATPNNVQLFSETPLHIAACMGYDNCICLLIDHGACLEVLMGSMKMTALHLAAQDGNNTSVCHLLTGGANIYARNARGQSALHLAALAQSSETVEELLKFGETKDQWKVSCFVCSFPFPGTRPCTLHMVCSHSLFIFCFSPLFKNSCINRRENWFP